MDAAQRRRYALLAWDRTPAILCFALLAAQFTLPWTVRHFVTEDGPSHLYGATIFWQLLFHHGSSIYSPLYTIQRALIPNWMSTIVLAGFSALAGAAHAEKLFASFALAAGFFAFAYAVRSLWPEAPKWRGAMPGAPIAKSPPGPEAPPWTPIANFLFHVWFLWMGFYNFYLGMALLPLAIAVYARRGGAITWRRAAALSAVLVLLFLTHIIPTIVAIVTVLTLALWRSFWDPQGRLRGLLLAAAATAPAVLLIAIYAYNASDIAGFAPQVAWAWRQFPMHLFLTAAGDDAGQRATWRFLLGYTAVAVCLMKRAEWRSPRGGLVFAILLTFLMYLFVPDAGFGGSQAKIRFSWAVFVLCGLFACSVSRMRMFRPIAALCIAWWMSANLLATYRTVQNVNRSAEDYMMAAGAIPPKASFVRLWYYSPGLLSRFGYAGIGRVPLFHFDASAAVQNHAIDLSDYEPLNPIFPVAYKKTAADPGQQSGLWSFEGPDPGSLKTLIWLDGSLPHPIGYVLLIGEPASPEAIHAGMPAMLQYLNANLTLAAESPSGTVRLYRRDHRLPPQ